MSNVQVSLNLYNLIRTLPAEDFKDLMDTLSAEEQVIENVASQILYGLTSMGSAGSASSIKDLFSTTYPTALDTARRHLINHADVFAAEKTKEAIRSAEASHRALTEARKVNAAAVLSLEQLNKAQADIIYRQKQEIEALHRIKGTKTP